MLRLSRALQFHSATAPYLAVGLNLAKRLTQPKLGADGGIRNHKPDILSIGGIPSSRHIRKTWWARRGSNPQNLFGLNEAPFPI